MIFQKYYWLSLYYKIKDYIQDYDFCLAFKILKYKSYSDLQSLLV